MLILAWAIMQPVAAQSFKPDWNAGWKAYENSDYATALQHFRPLAKQSHASAQYSLALMYRYNKGVLQDLVMAYVWFNVAATNGNSFADYDRDRVLSKLTAPERKLARKLSKLCLKKPAKCPEYSDD